MGAKTHKGFTIIESVLFLGITGMVMAVLLVGVGGTLNRERYKDAVSSFQDYLRGQYNLVSNVNNSRPNTEICQGGQIVAGLDSGKGTSDCTIVGRVIHSTANGDQITSAQVYATVDASMLAGVSDAAVLNSAQLIASPTKDTFAMGWGTKIVKPDSSVRPFSILIVRMPTSGLIHTYVLEQADKPPVAIIGNLKGLEMCVENSMFVAGGVGRVGVVLAKDAINSSGVQFLTEDRC
jgi:type II secretory pathway pseudopilin PulG